VLHRAAEGNNIREDAPEKLRYFVLEKAVECGLTPSSLRAITCSVLEERPNPDNWSLLRMVAVKNS
jgi:hypothetical protein